MCGAGALLALFTSARVQGWFVFMHWLKIPLLVRLGMPNRPQLFFRGLAYPCRSLFISAPVERGADTKKSSMSLGTWIIKGQEDSYSSAQTALTKPRLTVLYCHGNTGTRGVSHRVKLYNFLARPTCDGGAGCNVVAFDYRGFGDSSAERPTEEGLALDAEAVFRHIVEKENIPSDRVVIWGHSLGSAVAIRLVHDLCAANSPPAGVILEAPLTSIADVVLGRFPLTLFDNTAVRNFLSCQLAHKFPSIHRVSQGVISCPSLVIHSTSDKVVPFDQGQELFKELKYRSSETRGMHHQRNPSTQDTKHSSANVKFVRVGNHGGHKYCMEDRQCQLEVLRFIDECETGIRAFCSEFDHF